MVVTFKIIKEKKIKSNEITFTNWFLTKFIWIWRKIDNYPSVQSDNNIDICYDQHSDCNKQGTIPTEKSKVLVFNYITPNHARGLCLFIKVNLLTTLVEYFDKK